MPANVVDLAQWKAYKYFLKHAKEMIALDPIHTYPPMKFGPPPPMPLVPYARQK